MRSTWRVTVSSDDLFGFESTLDDVRALLSTRPGSLPGRGGPRVYLAAPDALVAVGREDEAAPGS